VKRNFEGGKEGGRDGEMVFLSVVKDSFCERREEGRRERKGATGYSSWG